MYKTGIFLKFLVEYREDNNSIKSYDLSKQIYDIEDYKRYWPKFVEEIRNEIKLLIEKNKKTFIYLGITYLDSDNEIELLYLLKRIFEVKTLEELLECHKEEFDLTISKYFEVINRNGALHN